MLEKIISAGFAIWSLFATGNDGRIRQIIGEEMGVSAGYICSDCIPRERIVAPGIGIDLTSTYGTVAIRYHNLSVVDVGRVSTS